MIDITEQDGKCFAIRGGVCTITCSYPGELCERCKFYKPKGYERYDDKWVRFDAPNGKAYLVAAESIHKAVRKKDAIECPATCRIIKEHDKRDIPREEYIDMYKSHNAKCLMCRYNEKSNLPELMGKGKR